MSQKSLPRLSPQWIDSHAHGIVKALQKKGFESYLVGGCVRDLLLGIEPKDFDIATTAHPDDVKNIIFKAYVIGKRFRLVLVRREDQQYEVATFRKEVKEDPEADEDDDQPQGDNFFGTPEEDALRRDFTINALFYDSITHKLIDHAGGLTDLQDGWVRMIGDPTVRLQEDPIRIMRALRLAHKVGFAIEPSLRKAMSEQASTLQEAALPRKREEFLKWLRLKDPALAFIEAYDLGLLEFLSPMLHKLFQDEDKSQVFLSYLSAAHEKSMDKSSAVDLFGLLVFAYVRAEIAPDAKKSLKAYDLLDHPELMTFMKDEMGLFKYEQSLVARSIQLQSTLLKTEEFRKKGARRQIAVLKNESFPLALNLANRDYLLGPDQWHFWLSKYWEALPQISSLRTKEKSSRKTKTRKKRSKTTKRAKANAEPN